MICRRPSCRLMLSLGRDRARGSAEHRFGTSAAGYLIRIRRTGASVQLKEPRKTQWLVCGSVCLAAVRPMRSSSARVGTQSRALPRQLMVTS